MDLRDWFAGQALIGLLASAKDPILMANSLADMAYTMAEVMIFHRKYEEFMEKENG